MSLGFRSGNWKLVLKKESHKLYDTTKLGERFMNMIHAKPELAAQLKAEMLELEKKGSDLLIPDAKDKIKQTFISGNWKMLRIKEARELYNLSEDIGEKRDLSASEPARVEQLMAQLVKIESNGRSRP